jgi:hypothetical protein
MEGKYSIELFHDGETGIEEILGREDSFDIACVFYRHMCRVHPGRLVMLCDRARVLARSDRPETMLP